MFLELHNEGQTTCPPPHPTQKEKEKKGQGTVVNSNSEHCSVLFCLKLLHLNIHDSTLVLLAAGKCRIYSLKEP
jgi:hypothetical protein